MNLKDYGIISGINLVLCIAYNAFVLLTATSTCTPFRCDGGVNNCTCSVMGSNLLYTIAKPWLLLSILIMVIYLGLKFFSQNESQTTK
jgi:hypothetical protein